MIHARKCAAALLVLLLLTGCRENHGETETAAPPHGPTRVTQAPDGSALIHLTAEEQTAVALRTANPEPGSLPPEQKAVGRVIDPTPLTTLAGDLFSSEAALAADSRELERLRILFAQDRNASQRAVDTQAALVQRDEIAAKSLRLRLLTEWGQTVAAQKDLASFVESLARHEMALVRLDLPAGESVSQPTMARLFTLAAPEKPVAAAILGPAPAVDPQTQGQSWFALVKEPGSQLQRGQVLQAAIELPGHPLTGVLVPASAIVRAQGRAWIYLQTSKTNFVRREISLDHPRAGGWLVTREVSDQDRLVITGAQLLFSEELGAPLEGGH